MVDKFKITNLKVLVFTLGLNIPEQVTYILKAHCSSNVGHRIRNIFI